MVHVEGFRLLFTQEGKHDDPPTHFPATPVSMTTKAPPPSEVMTEEDSNNQGHCDSPDLSVDFLADNSKDENTAAAACRENSWKHFTFCPENAGS